MLIRSLGATGGGGGAVGAGAGETVYWCRGRESSFPFLPSEVPTDATVVGIVDSVSVASPRRGSRR